jgi:hypothetical protein
VIRKKHILKTAQIKAFEICTSLYINSIKAGKAFENIMRNLNILEFFGVWQ